MPFWWSGQHWTAVQRKLSHWFLWWCSFSVPFLTLLCLHPNICSFDQCHVLSRDCYWLVHRSIQVLYSPLHLQIIWSPVGCISWSDYTSQCLSLASLFEPGKADRQCCNQASPQGAQLEIWSGTLQAHCTSCCPAQVWKAFPTETCPLYHQGDPHLWLSQLLIPAADYQRRKY